MRRKLALVAALVLANGVEADAQIRASETGSISQIIDGTKITITYARPRGRNRPQFFGVDTVVVWNEVWTPGANEATTLEVSKPIKLDGHQVGAGKYSLWMIVHQEGDWTLLLDSKVDRWHTNRPDTIAPVLKFPVHVTQAPYLDVLTWSMPQLRADGGTLAMQWGTTRIAMKLDVQSRYPLTMTESDASPYLGTYDVVRTARGKEVKEAMTLRMKNGSMQALIDPKNEDMQNAYLLHMKGDMFTVAYTDDGGDFMFIMGPGLTYEFTRTGGRAVRFEARDDKDKLVASGTRKP